MTSDADPLHMLFFPFMLPGHMLPMLDMAKLFAAHGVSVTILTPPANAAVIRPTIPNSIRIHTIPFPSAEFGLSENCDSYFSVIPEYLKGNFYKAVSSLGRQFDAVLADLSPHCIVSDMFMPWTYHIAAARGIPRLVFNGTSYFSLCAGESLIQCGGLLDDAGPSALLPGLPHCIEMLKTQLLDLEKLAGTPMEFLIEAIKEAAEADRKSYGAVMNTFYELEPDYADHLREAIGMKSWHVGPVSLFNKTTKEISEKSMEQQLPDSAIGECLKWLDGKPPGSVVYACFGSLSLFTTVQLREMAVGFEESGHPFIWVVRNEGDDWAPEGYEERIKGRGMVIGGWAPQLLILNHKAVGGFVTHCGWNSSLEAICAGLPMVTWPLYAEQFYNERLLVEVLKIGVTVGSKVFNFMAEERSLIEAATVAAAVRSVIGGGEEAEERRRRARGFAEMARRAAEDGGSSSLEVKKLIQELTSKDKK